MVSSTFLACHLHWKNEKKCTKKYNLSHVKSTFSPLYFNFFFLHFSCISIIISIFFSSQCRFSRKTLPSTILLPSEKNTVPFIEFMMSNRISNAYLDYCEFKLSACYFSFQISFCCFRYEVNELILVPSAWFFSHCSMLHLIITSVNRPSLSGTSDVTHVQSECESWPDLKVWKKCYTLKL